MSANSRLIRQDRGHDLRRGGLLIGLAGGMAEIAVISLHAALTGGDAGMVARQVAAAVGLDGASAAVGVAVHMGLAVALGLGLAAVMPVVLGRAARDAAVFGFMLASLAAIWAINFFVVLPMISPGFVHLLPYAVTLTSKLAFGLAAAATWRALAPRGAERSVGMPSRAGVFDLA